MEIFLLYLKYVGIYNKYNKYRKFKFDEILILIDNFLKRMNVVFKIKIINKYYVNINIFVL